MAEDLVNMFAGILTVIVITTLYYKWCYTYWSRRGFFQAVPSYPFGTIKQIVAQMIHINDALTDSYNQLKSKGVTGGGIYWFFRPVYMPIDGKIIKDMLTTNFANFPNHGIYTDEKNDPLNRNLFNLNGAKWKNTRAQLLPAFASGKIKAMFHIMAACSKNLRESIDKEAEARVPVNIKEVVSRFTIDVIANAAFGIESNSIKNPDEAFARFAKLSVHASIIDNVLFFCSMALPGRLLQAVKFKITKNEVERFCLNLVKNNMKYREENNVSRSDLFQSLIQLRLGDDLVENLQQNRDKLKLNEIAAHCLVFLIGGFETSAATTTYAIYELAKNQDIQDRLREEINRISAKYDGQYSYEAFNEMKYLEQVITETLRKYPPIPLLIRECSNNYIVPATSTVVEKGTLTMIPICAIHHDQDLYPEPEKFLPNRFAEENKKNIPQFAWIPFGGGPRICIGQRFAMMQTKIGLTTLLKDHRVTLNDKTDNPLLLAQKVFITAPLNPVWVNFERLN